MEWTRFIHFNLRQWHWYESSELVLAMTPGSKDPEEERNEKDLGRFGMGLKTASFSQCKRLTCITKKESYCNNKTLLGYRLHQ
jgi:hypothetical protein